MFPCPYCPFISRSEQSNRGHIRHHHVAELRANSIRRPIGEATHDSLEYCEMCKLHVLQAQIMTPSGLQRAHDSSTCHKQNMAHRAAVQHSSSGRRSGDDDDDDGIWDGGGNEDDDLSNETYGDSEESELRTLDSRYGAVLESFECGSDRFRGDDARNQGDDERNIHDWLGRNDRVVNA
jgi:hypothetical protein